MKDGQVCLGYDLGHGNISGCVPFSINDGNWYRVGASFTQPFVLYLVYLAPSLHLFYLRGLLSRCKLSHHTLCRKRNETKWFLALLWAFWIDINWFCLKVRVNRNKQRGVLSVDGRYTKQMTSPKRVRLFFFLYCTFIFTGWCLWNGCKKCGYCCSHQADLLDVVGLLYVGGLPKNYTTKRIGPVKWYALEQCSILCHAT